MIELTPSPLDALTRARALLSAAHGWTTHAMAKTARGVELTNVLSPDAACFCLVGAVARATGVADPYLLRAEPATRNPDWRFMSPSERECASAIYALSETIAASALAPDEEDFIDYVDSLGRVTLVNDLCTDASAPLALIDATLARLQSETA